MATVQPKTRNGKTIYVARWVDPEGHERSKSFATAKGYRKADATNWGIKMEEAKLSRAYVDPSAGKITFGHYAPRWVAAQVHHRPATADKIRQNLRVHMLPVFERRPLSSIRKTDIDGFVQHLRGKKLAASTIEVCCAHLRGILLGAVKDRLIAESPYRDIKLPERLRARIEPPTPSQVADLSDAMPDQYRAMVVVGAGCGLRIGEAAGLSLDRVDFLRRQITVDRQLVRSRSGKPPYIGPTKTKAGNRVVPIPERVLTALAAHVEAHPPTMVDVSGTSLPLLFTDDKGRGDLRYQRFSALWRAACDRVGLAESVTFHDLRHHYASVLIAEGCDVLVVAAMLGDSDIEVVKNTYLHLWPNSDERVRAAVDRAWSSEAASKVAAASSAVAL